MAMPRAPIDPYCGKNGKAALVKHDDADANLASLSSYARGLHTHVWRYPDGKLALDGEHIKGPLVFGAEGDTIERTAAAALNALHEQATGIRASIELNGRVESQARNQRLDPVAASPDPIDITEKALAGQINTSVREFVTGTPGIDEPAREIGHRWFGGNMLIPIESALRGLGAAGSKLADLFKRRNELLDRVRATAFSRLSAQLERLTPEEIATGYARYVEHGEADAARRPVLESVYTAINDIDEQFYAGLKAQGVEVAQRVGAGPLNPTGRYFPHRRDLSALGDHRLAASMIAETKERAAKYNVNLTDEQALEVIERQGWGTVKSERAIDKLIESAARHNHDLPRADAERLLNQIVDGNSERVAGNLERDRELDFGGYITDMRRAYTATWTRNAYRLSDVAVLGRADENVHALLGQMQYDPAYGARATKFAREVYDLEIGRKQLKLSPLFQELYGWQSAKLSLAVLANSTQSLNTFMRVGLSPFFRAMRDAIIAPGEFGGSLLHERSTVATRAGALPVQMYGSTVTSQLVESVLGDVRQRGMTALLGNDTRVVGQAAGHGIDTFLGGTLAPFRWVENWNRSVAQRAGEYYFDQLAEQLATRGEAGLQHRAIGRRLAELDLDPTRVLDAVRRGDTQAVHEMRTLAGLRTSNETQFKSNFQAMPLWANNSEPGRFLFQYKNFAINQAKFALKELDPRNAKRDPQRYIRAVATVAAAYPAVGIALTTARQNIMGPTLAGQQLADAMDDPTIGHLVKAGFISMSLAGGLGIIADMGMTAALGNTDAIKNFFVPPAFSTIANVVGGTASAARGIVNGDTDELKRARASYLRELGGIGGGIEQTFRRHEGTAETPINPIEAIRGLL